MGNRFSLLALVAVAVLSACDGNDAPTPPLPAPDSSPPVSNFEITVSNLTNGQPFSPLALVAHFSAYRYFAVGETASPELEMLAEGGDNAALIDAAENNGAVYAVRTGSGIVLPGSSETLNLELVEATLPFAELSLATMLVNTNDAFAGFQGLPLARLGVGDELEIAVNVYDAGTEADSETAASIPGPAGGGEGFNAVRDDRADGVSGHAGVISIDDGLADSTLGEQHRFQNPAATVRIIRVD